MIDTDNYVFDIGSEKIMGIPTESVERTVKKHSKNIIDLIEVKDMVKTLDRWGNIDICYIDSEDMLQAVKEDIVLNNFIIKSIVTKEAFAQAEYKIEKGE